MHLQAAYARRQVDHPRQLQIFKRMHQRVHAKACGQVNFGRPEFQQHIAVAGQTGHEARIAEALVEHHPADSRNRRGTGAERGACGNPVHRREAQPVSGLELPQLPQIGLDDCHRADEAPEAGAIGAQNHRHVAGEIDRADGIRVVVNVGRMKARLAAIGAHPLRLGTDQAHAGA